MDNRSFTIQHLAHSAALFHECEFSAARSASRTRERERNSGKDYSRGALNVAHVGEERFGVRGVLGVDVLHEARAGVARRRRRVLEAQLLHLVDQSLRAHTRTTHCTTYAMFT